MISLIKALHIFMKYTDYAKNKYQRQIKDIKALSRMLIAASKFKISRGLFIIYNKKIQMYLKFSTHFIKEYLEIWPYRS